MNKKGMYMSISVLVILFALFIVFQNQASVQQKEKDLVADRAIVVAMDDFMRDMDTYYTYEILKDALKPALEALTVSVTPTSNLIQFSELASVMADPNRIPPEYTTPNTLNQALSSLSFAPDSKEFTYEVKGVRQTDYLQFEVEFSVDYKFTFGSNTWTATDKQVIVPVTVYSLSHPSYSETYGPITSDWVSTYTAQTCYIKEIFSDNLYCSDDKPNIMPPNIVAATP
jgi:hypothetical protein